MITLIKIYLNRIHKKLLVPNKLEANMLKYNILKTDIFG